MLAGAVRIAVVSAGTVMAAVGWPAAALAADAPAAADAADALVRPRPRVLVWIEGSTEEDTLWRGWPALVRVQTLAGEPPSDVQMRGPRTVALIAGRGAWVISAAESGKLVAGSYTLSAGDESVDVVVAEPPAQLDPVQRAAHARLVVASALATGDASSARQAADAWVHADPDSCAAREALGDALRASGDADGALEAYGESLRRLPRRLDPPPAGLHAKIAALLRDKAARLPTRTAVLPTAEEAGYQEMVDAGDRAFVHGRREEAADRYAEADAFRREKGLTVSTAELDERRAMLGGAPALGSRASDPGQPPAASAAPVIVPPVIATPSAIAATPLSSAPADAGPAPGSLVPASELDEAKILADASGQWASAAVAGSQYSAPNYSAARMTGPPDVPVAGDSVNAWCHGSGSSETEWIELTFALPVEATEVRVRQTNAPGAIARVEAIEPDGSIHLWWEGSDTFKAAIPNTLAWFAVRVPRTEYRVARVKITLRLATVPGWKEIDAVQLVGSPRG